MAAVQVKRYEQVARSLADDIETGRYREGDRLPSVRQLTSRLGVSPATVMSAYRWLEDHGWVEVRPQSGHYVAPRGALPAEPARSKPSPEPTAVDVGDLAMMVLRDGQDPGLVQFGAAVPHPDMLPTRQVARALSRAAREHGSAAAAYSLAGGRPELREAVARRLRGLGCALGADDLIITNGCQEAVSLALQSLCRPGDAVAVESPTYYNFLQLLNVMGLRAVELPTSPRDGIDLVALERAIREGGVKACVLTTNFSNPLGAAMPTEKKQLLVELLARYDLPLIEDDIYGDLNHRGERPTVAKAFDEDGRVLLCSSFSKTLSPGLRVGWIAPGRWRAAVERHKSVSNIANATLPQLAVAELLEAGGYDHHLRRLRRTYADLTRRMARAVARHFPPGTRVTRPSGGFVLWVEGPATLDSVRLYQRALAAGITLAPGPLFTAQDRYRHCLRLNAAHWSDGMEPLLARLGKLAAE